MLENWLIFYKNKWIYLFPVIKNNNKVYIHNNKVSSFLWLYENLWKFLSTKDIMKDNDWDIYYPLDDIIKHFLTNSPNNTKIELEYHVMNNVIKNNLKTLTIQQLLFFCHDFNNHNIYKFFEEIISNTNTIEELLSYDKESYIKKLIDLSINNNIIKTKEIFIKK